jgi:hypothetical protein
MRRQRRKYGPRKNIRRLPIVPYEYTFNTYTYTGSVLVQADYMREGSQYFVAWTRYYDRKAGRLWTRKSTSNQ